MAAQQQQLRAAIAAAGGVLFDVRLSRTDKIYRPGDLVKGLVIVGTNGSMSHQGIFMQVEGTVQMQMSAKSVGLFEAFYNSVKPISLVGCNIPVTPAGKLPDGLNELPFEFKLEPLTGQPLYETYHGVFINITYTIKCDLRRGMLAHDSTKTIEFLVEMQKPEPLLKNSATDFSLTTEDFDKKVSRKHLPQIRITGRILTSSCDIRKPFQGAVTVHECNLPVKSIELQLVRVETCGCGEGFAKEETEIQNIQIADGDVARGMEIPMYMVFPRLFTCPSIPTHTFKIEFEVNLVVLMEDNHAITKKFPIILYRPVTTTLH
eukprot:TRINITY_DN2993_c0_g1_i1.p1 TRINITY_DN2993_c0_g1~~TRINITY_DN2993_c0_g1_i1.p1  ORF type:complete len:319 (-),score=88.34 TRINITY_DN2993_c0_g1_i1:50-1006(-)